MSNEVVRQIVKGWLVVGSKGPLLFTANEKKATETFIKVSKVDPSVRMDSITTHIERFKQIGTNLITRKLPVLKCSIMAFRNILVTETHRCNNWESVRKKYNLPKISYDEMSQWLMDHMTYNTKEVN